MRRLVSCKGDRPYAIVHRLTGKDVLILTNIMSQALLSAITGARIDGLKCPIFEHLSSRMALTTQIVRFRVRFGP